MTRIGIIGLGFMGRVHYDTYSKVSGANVVAVCDADPRRASGDLSDTWGNVDKGATRQLPMDRIRGMCDWRELLADPNVDVLDICLPTPAMCMRFWPEWEWLKRAQGEGRYGRLIAAHFRRVGSLPGGWFRNGALSGGAILDLHVHDTDFVYHLFGRPKSVFSTGTTGKSGEIDHVLTQYQYRAPGAAADDAAPASVTAEGSWLAAEGCGFRMQYTVHFENATADYDFGRKDHALLLHAEGKTEPVEVAKQDGYVGELTYFLECVRTGKKPKRVTAEDAVASIEIVEAEKRSVERGEQV
jgi:predicted dehydrogenase